MLYSFKRLAEHADFRHPDLLPVKNRAQRQIMETTWRWLLELIERGDNMNSFDRDFFDFFGRQA